MEASRRAFHRRGGATEEATSGDVARPPAAAWLGGIGSPTSVTCYVRGEREAPNATPFTGSAPDLEMHEALQKNSPCRN